MKPSLVLNQNRQAIIDIIRHHHAKNPRVFGSVLSHEDTEKSDLDLLVDPTSKMTLMDVAAIQYELKKLLDISVDVLTPNALPEKFRDDVLSKARPI